MSADDLASRATEALRGVIDPEIGINVVDLGLVYGIEATPKKIAVALTMTTPSCPLGDYLSDLARQAIRAALPEVPEVTIDLVWDPPWSAARMTPAARQALGWDDR